MIAYSWSERIRPREYVDFLRRSDLGSEYPRKDFGARIATLLERADICVTGRSESGRLVGVCLGLTDFAYFLFLTDLGVDRSFVRQGIGATLVRMAHEAAGGEADICVITWANRGSRAILSGVWHATVGVGRGQARYGVGVLHGERGNRGT